MTNVTTFWPVSARRTQAAQRETPLLRWMKFQPLLTWYWPFCCSCPRVNQLSIFAAHLRWDECKPDAAEEITPLWGQEEESASLADWSFCWHLEEAWNSLDPFLEQSSVSSQRVEPAIPHWRVREGLWNASLPTNCYYHLSGYKTSLCFLVLPKLTSRRRDWFASQVRGGLLMTLLSMQRWFYDWKLL